jgi:hypothetical protein
VHAMKACGGWRYGSTHSATTLDGDEWSALHLEHFTLGESAPNSHWLGGWVGARTSLAALEKSRISCMFWKLNHDICFPAVSLALCQPQCSGCLILVLSCWSSFS